MQELEEEYPQGPDINSVIVFPLFQHFGRHVIQGPAKGVSHVLFLRAPPEIAELDVPSFVQQQVFWFEVAVDNRVLVQVVNPDASLEEENKGLPFGQFVQFHFFTDIEK